MKIYKLLLSGRLCIALLIFLSAGNCSAQFNSGLSCFEKRWALFHPFAAFKVKKIYKNNVPIYLELKNNRQPDAFESGGKLDAFRHVYFMAMFSQKICARKIKKLGIAHEKGNYKNYLKNKDEFGERADSLATVMDLQNNKTGIDLGKNNKKSAALEMKKKVLELIQKGEAVYLKRNSEGKYVNCAGEIIDLSNYKGKWYVPKCLVKSNE